MTRSVWLKEASFLFIHLRSHWGRLFRSEPAPNKSKYLSSAAAISSTEAMSWICTCIKVAITVPPGTCMCLVHLFKMSNSTKWLPCETGTTVGVTSTPPASYSPTPFTTTTCTGRWVSIFILPDTLRPSHGPRDMVSCRCTLHMIFCLFFRCFLTVWTAAKAKCMALGSLTFGENLMPWVSTSSSKVLRSMLVPTSTGTWLL